MRERISAVLLRARYAAMGAAAGAAIGGLFSRNAASTGGAIGGLVGATVADTRGTVDSLLEEVKTTDVGLRSDEDQDRN